MDDVRQARQQRVGTGHVKLVRGASHNRACPRTVDPELAERGAVRDPVMLIIPGFQRGIGAQHVLAAAAQEHQVTGAERERLTIRLDQHAAALGHHVDPGPCEGRQPHAPRRTGVGTGRHRAAGANYFDWEGALSVTIRKFNYMDSTYTEAEDLATLVRLVAAGRLHPEIDRVEDWSRTGDAIAALLSRQTRGHVVLTIGSPR